jgi:hypothetical protein
MLEMYLNFSLFFGDISKFLCARTTQLRRGNICTN